MKIHLMLLCVTTTLLLGCSSTTTKPSTGTNNDPSNQTTSWFCEGTSGIWSCSKLTAQEIAQRTSEKVVKQEKLKDAENAAQPWEPPVDRAIDGAKNRALEESTTGDQPGNSIDSTRPHATAVNAATPGYISLAYKPKTPTSLLDLPETFWAIQIMALQSQDDLNQFVMDKQLVGIAGAKVASNGKLYYVLLLGVYESKSVAEEAWKSRPQSIRYLQPYYRSLGSLQEAVGRVEDL